MRLQLFFAVILLVCFGCKKETAPTTKNPPATVKTLVDTLAGSYTLSGFSYTLMDCPECTNDTSHYSGTIVITYQGDSLFYSSYYLMPDSNCASNYYCFSYSGPGLGFNLSFKGSQDSISFYENTFDSPCETTIIEAIGVKAP